jgi:2-(1,2-epoxy-1,2-dihydrophenyl)acetyl-CoA isomerase
LSGVTFQQEGKIGIIEMDYSSTMNSLRQELRDGLFQKLQEAEESDARIIIIKGNGRSFSAGGDLSELQGLHNSVEAKEYVENVHKLIKRVHSFPKVTIALIEGYAFAAGLMLAAACDLIYAGDKAKFSLPFLTVGLVPDCGTSFLLTRLIGIQKAKELAYTRKVINTEEALQIGLIANSFPAEEVFHETKCIADQIAQGPPKALAMTKTNYETALVSNLDAALTLEAITQGIFICGEEHFEGRQAFFEKRKPSF